METDCRIMKRYLKLNLGDPDTESITDHREEHFMYKHFGFAIIMTCNRLTLSFSDRLLDC